MLKPKLLTISAATAIKPYGRFLINQSQQLELISSAAHFGFSFEGLGCTIFASIPNTEGHNYLQYELDGVYQKRIKVQGNAKEPIVISSPGPGKHTIWIYKATEAHTGPIVIKQINGTNLTPLTRPAAPSNWVYWQQYYLRCGRRLVGGTLRHGRVPRPAQCLSGLRPQSGPGSKDYFVLSSVSGIGVYRNWNSDGPTMPQVFEKTNFQANNPQTWDFKTFTPQVVSIALGTNDFSKGDGKKARLPFDSATFVTNYVRFVQVVKSKYPNARIALLSSPMINGAGRTLLQNCLKGVKNSVGAQNPTAKSVELFFFEPMQARETVRAPQRRGSCYSG